MEEIGDDVGSKDASNSVRSTTSSTENAGFEGRDEKLGRREDFVEGGSIVTLMAGLATDETVKLAHHLDDGVELGGEFLLDRGSRPVTKILVVGRGVQTVRSGNIDVQVGKNVAAENVETVPGIMVDALLHLLSFNITNTVGADRDTSFGKEADSTSTTLELVVAVHFTEESEELKGRGVGAVGFGKVVLEEHFGAMLAFIISTKRQGCNEFSGSHLLAGEEKKSNRNVPGSLTSESEDAVTRTSAVQDVGSGQATFTTRTEDNSTSQEVETSSRETRSLDVDGEVGALNLQHTEDALVTTGDEVPTALTLFVEGDGSLDSGLEGSFTLESTTITTHNFRELIKGHPDFVLMEERSGIFTVIFTSSISIISIGVSRS